MNEEILGIIEAKGFRLALTTDRLIVAKGGVLERIDSPSLGATLYGVPGGALIGTVVAGIAGAAKGRKEEKAREKLFADLTAEGILSRRKENFAIPWDEVTRAEVGKESWLTEGMRLKVFTCDKKREFAEIKGRMLGKAWHTLNTTIPSKVTVPKIEKSLTRRFQS
jgi:hypothetical protein